MGMNEITYVILFPNVCAVYYITGLTDMTMVAKFRNRRDLSDFIKKDLALPFIQRTNNYVVLVIGL